METENPTPDTGFQRHFHVRSEIQAPCRGLCVIPWPQLSRLPSSYPLNRPLCSHPEVLTLALHCLRCSSLVFPLLAPSHRSGLSHPPHLRPNPKPQHVQERGLERCMFNELPKYLTSRQV